MDSTVNLLIVKDCVVAFFIIYETLRVVVLYLRGATRASAWHPATVASLGKKLYSHCPVVKPANIVYVCQGTAEKQLQ